MYVANCEGFSDKFFVCCLSIFCCYCSQVSGSCSTLLKSIVTLANNTAMNPEADSQMFAQVPVASKAEVAFPYWCLIYDHA